VRLVATAALLLVTSASCGGKPASRPVATATDAPARSAEAASPDAASGGDLTRAEQQGFLNRINDLCKGTYCEGSFSFDFDHLECHFEKGVCAISFVMVTEEPTAPGVTARRIRSQDEHGPVFAELLSVVPPDQCDRYDAGLEPQGAPCTVVDAVCALFPIRSVTDFEKLHWDKLSSCVSTIEDVLIPPPPPAQHEAHDHALDQKPQSTP
jgi:hypothetical protein